MKQCGWLLFGFGLLLLSPALGGIFDATIPLNGGSIEGTAVNVTNVIGVGNSGTATEFCLTNGSPNNLSAVSQTIDAGQYSDGITMYLNNSGVLSLIRNDDGNNLQNYNTGDTFGVSGVVEVGGARYCVLGGTSSGVRLLALATGVQTALGSATNYNFSAARGLDAFMRPGGTTLNDIAIGIQRGFGTPQLDIYYAAVNGLVRSVGSTSGNGTIKDVSFDMLRDEVWFGTTGSILFSQPFNFGSFAITAPEVSLSVSNGVAAVGWLGRTLEGSSSGSNWQAVATAPMSPTQLFPPATYLEPLTNTTRFFRARW